MLTPGGIASRARASEGQWRVRKADWPATRSNNIRQYVSYKIKGGWFRFTGNRNQHQSKAIWSDSVWDHSARHAMANRTALATHIEIYGYVDPAPVSGPKSPLSKSFDCCSV